MLGSDTGTPGVLPGISTYYEMALMEKSGLDPFEVLQCAIVNPIEFLGLSEQTGSISKNKKANMIFHVGPKDAQKGLTDQGEVKVVETPERVVASVGARGSYTEKNFQAAAARLEDWLENQARYKKKAEPYAVFWNGPYVPGFLKRFEVHIPLEEVGQGDQAAADKGGAEPLCRAD